MVDNLPESFRPISRWTDFELDLAADNPEQEHYTGKIITSNYLRAWRNQLVLMIDWLDLLTGSAYNRSLEEG